MGFVLGRQVVVACVGSLALSCGDSREVRVAEQGPIAEAGGGACAPGITRMLECKSEITRRVRMGGIGYDYGESSMREAAKIQAQLTGSTATVCESFDQEPIQRMHRCSHLDCEGFAKCVIHATEMPTLASGSEVPECAEGDSAYEAESGFRRLVWCSHPNGVPHGPWVVWAGGIRRETGRMLEGVRQRAEWHHFDDKGEPLQPVPKGPSLTGVNVEIGDIRVSRESNLQLDLVRHRICQKYLAGVKRCYVGSESKASARVLVAMDIGAPGSVQKATVNGLNSFFDTCVQKFVIKHWRFGSPKLGSYSEFVSLRVSLEVSSEGAPLEGP